MKRFTPQEGGIIVSISSVMLAQREFRRRFPGHLIKHYGVWPLALKRLGQHEMFPSSRSAENIATIAKDIEEEPETSTRRRAMHLGINRRPLRRILVKDLKMIPYKVQIVHQLLTVDHQTRLTYAQVILNLNEGGGLFFIENYHER